MNNQITQRVMIRHFLFILEQGKPEQFEKFRTAFVEYARNFGFALCWHEMVLATVEYQEELFDQAVENDNVELADGLLARREVYRNLYSAMHGIGHYFPIENLEMEFAY